MIPILSRPVWRPVLMAVAFLFSFQSTPAGSDEPVPVLKLANGSVSEDGHIKIEWDLPQAATEVELQQAKDENFEAAKMVYRGPDNATFISGLENGTYYYRIRRVDGAWSAPVMLTVKHHSLRLAFILFALGAVVFTLTVFVVVKGAFHASAD